MDFLNRLDKLDSRILYVLLLVVFAITLIHPVGLAITVGEDTRKVFDTMDNLPPGSLVWLGMDFAPSAAPELMPGAIAAIRHGLSKDLRFVAGSTIQVMAGNTAQQLWDAVSADVPNKEYGVDFINLGYKPGEKVFYEKLLNNAHEAAMGIDNYGNDLGQFPIMQDFKNLKDASVILTFISAKGIEDYIAHVSDPHKIPLLVGAVAVQVSEMMPFLRSGQIHGLIKGMRGSAEYEVVTGKPGPAVAGMDTQSFAHILVILFITLGDIGYFLSKKQSRMAA